MEEPERGLAPTVGHDRLRSRWLPRAEQVSDLAVLVVCLLLVVGGLAVSRREARAGSPPADLAPVAGGGPLASFASSQVDGQPIPAQEPVPVLPATSRRPPPRQIRDSLPGRIDADYGVVMDADSGEVLWSRGAHVRVAPASVTKIVTALVVLDRAALTDVVRVRVDSRDMPDSTVMGVWPGEELTVEDLLYGMMLPSGNDAALALAEHVAGSSRAFAELMNAKARSLGLTDSSFANPHGLDEEGHATTAYDIAMLARVGMQQPAFRALAGARSYETTRGKGYELSNLNRLLWRFNGADGVKIGYTPEAGRTIVSSAVRDGHRVLVALLHGGDIYADSETLLNWAFSSFEW